MSKKPTPKQPVPRSFGPLTGGAVLLNPDIRGSVGLSFDDDVGLGAADVVAEYMGVTEPIMRLSFHVTPYGRQCIRCEAFTRSKGRRGEVTTFYIDLPEME